MSNRKILLFAYGIGMMSVVLLSQTVMRWFQYFYSPPAGNAAGLNILVGIGLVGVPMSVTRIIEALLNPIVSAMSDKCKSKLGRRLPFLLLGFPPSLLAFILVWFPPVNSESGYNFVWLMLALLLLFTSFSLVYAPYLSLLGELTQNSEEVMFTSSIQALATFVAAIISSALAAFFIEKIGFSGMGLAIGGIILCTFLPTLLFVRETKVITHHKLPGVIQSLKMCVENKEFLHYMLLQTGIWFCMNTISITLPYITELMLKLPQENAGYLMSVSYVVAFAFTPILNRLGRVFSKVQMISVAAVSFSALIILMAMWGVLISVAFVWVLLIFMGITLGIIYTYTNPIIVDIASKDAKKTGQPRDAIFFGSYSMLVSIVMAANSVLMPILFLLFGAGKSSFAGIQISLVISSLFLIFCTLVYRKNQSSKISHPKRGES